MGEATRHQMAPWSTAKFLPRCFDFWTFSVGLNVTTTTKKVVNFLGEEKCTIREKSARPEKILAMHTIKGPPPYVGMGPPNG